MTCGAEKGRQTRQASAHDTDRMEKPNLHGICRTSLVSTCHVTTVRATCELVSHMPHVGYDTGTHLPYMAPVLSGHRELFSLPKGLPKGQVSNDKQHEASACHCEKQKLLLSVLKSWEGDAKSEIRYKAAAYKGLSKSPYTNKAVCPAENILDMVPEMPLGAHARVTESCTHFPQ